MSILDPFRSYSHDYAARILSEDGSALFKDFLRRNIVNINEDFLYLRKDGSYELRESKSFYTALYYSVSEKSAISYEAFNEYFVNTEPFAHAVTSFIHPKVFEIDGRVYYNRVEQLPYCNDFRELQSLPEIAHKHIRYVLIYIATYLCPVNYEEFLYWLATIVTGGTPSERYKVFYRNTISRDDSLGDAFQILLNRIMDKTMDSIGYSELDDKESTFKQYLLQTIRCDYIDELSKGNTDQATDFIENLPDKMKNIFKYSNSEKNCISTNFMIFLSNCKKPKYNIIESSEKKENQLNASNPDFLFMFQYACINCKLLPAALTIYFRWLLRARPIDCKNIKSSVV